MWALLECDRDLGRNSSRSSSRGRAAACYHTYSREFGSSEVKSEGIWYLVCVLPQQATDLCSTSGAPVLSLGHKKEPPQATRNPAWHFRGYKKSWSGYAESSVEHSLFSNVKSSTGQHPSFLLEGRHCCCCCCMLFRAKATRIDTW